MVTPTLERAPLLHLPNYAVRAFGERVDRHSTEQGVTAALAYANGHPAGYAYEHGERYWQRTSPTPADKYIERPAVALKEIGVRPTWRKTGTARRIHDALLAARDEPYVTLMVDLAAGDGKVQAQAVTGLAGPDRDDSRHQLTDTQSRSSCAVTWKLGCTWSMKGVSLRDEHAQSRIHRGPRQQSSGR